MAEHTEVQDLEADLRAAEQRIRELEAKRHAIIARSSDLTLFFERDGTIAWASPSSLALFGFEPEELVGRNGLELIHPDDRPRVVEEFLTGTREPGEHVRTSFRVQGADGGIRWVEEVTTNLVDEPDVGYIVGNLRDVTEQHLANDELGHLARHDTLTGLPNRLLLLERLDDALRRSRSRAAVLHVGLDHFKDVNDSFGHDAGDGLLAEVAARLRSVTRADDTIGRTGGDEFVIVCERVADIDQATDVARRLDAALREPFLVDGAEVFITASVGVALSPPDDGVQLFQRADAAMYRAKEQGRSRITVFDAEAETAASSRIRMNAELRHALDNHELVVWYQPIVALDRGTVTGVEALVRWLHPTRGLVPPGDFLEVAEVSGAIREIGAFVLEQACADAARWREAGRTVEVSVNLAALQLVDEHLVEWVDELLVRSGFPAGLVTFEVTESAAMYDRRATDWTLRALRSLGVQLALDDFGTGYSSLSFLKKLPVDVVKIDSSFVRGLGRDEGDTQIVSGIISMARALRRAVVAEGVERPDQRDLLRSLGCRYGQGHLWSPAVPASQVEAMVERIDLDAAARRLG